MELVEVHCHQHQYMLQHKAVLVGQVDVKLFNLEVL